MCAGVLPQVDGADVSLDAGCGTQHLATVLPQTLEHHLHGVLQENGSHSQKTQQLINGFVLTEIYGFVFFKAKQKEKKQRLLSSQDSYGITTVFGSHLK